MYGEFRYCVRVDLYFAACLTHHGEPVMRYLSAAFCVLFCFSCSFDTTGLKEQNLQDADLPECGNGKLETGEACDDGNDVEGDGCSEACQMETGWFCTGEPSVCEPICGDGLVLGEEACDDGNDVEGDGCSADCQVETGWFCTGEPSVCETACGDGLVLGEEACDDGNILFGDGCSADCQVETGWSCAGEPSVCTPVCGDDLIVGPEVCEGLELGGETCPGLGYYRGDLACSADCMSYDESHCDGFCGDGVLEQTEGEECEEPHESQEGCKNLLYPGGILGCDNQCRWDESTCLQWVQVSAGHEHTCGLMSDGTLWCWGLNDYGQLGQGTTGGQMSTPQQVSFMGTDTAVVESGDYYTCVIRHNRTLWCWGDNRSGQLGNGTKTNSTVPVQVIISAVEPLAPVKQVSARLNHACAIRENGSLWCWGNNANGRLGDDSTNERLNPIGVPGMNAGVTQVSAGVHHTCAIRSTGEVFCWGLNDRGQLGDNSTTERRTPVAVVWPGLENVPAIADVTTGEKHTCVLLVAGAAYCFGDNGNGRLGDNTTTHRSVPTAVVGMDTDVRDLEIGYRHSCAIKTDDSAWCWGDNNAGRLGDGTTTDRRVPTAVLHMTSGVSMLSAGRRNTHAIQNLGHLYSWGRNNQGQLGDGSTTDRSSAVSVIWPYDASID